MPKSNQPEALEAPEPKDIHLFIPKFRIDETLEEVRECLEKGWTGLGFKTLEIEKAWSEYSGLPHSHFLNSATSGLHLAVRLLKERDGWKEGDEIITTPLTFVSSNHAILYENMKPVFADVDEYLCLDPQSVAEKIGPRTRAVLFVGLGGNTGRLDEIVALCRERNLSLILDAAHMSGTRWHDAHVGAESEVAVFSNQAVKNMPTADAGMICFRDAELDRDVRKWTWLGISQDTYSRTLDSQSKYKWYYDVEHVGFKYHGNSIMAAIGLVALKYLDEDNAYRRQLADWYDEDLLDVSGIEPVRVAPGCSSSRHLYQVLVDDRDDVVADLNRNRIYPGVHYRDNTVYRMYAQSRELCPRASDASNRVISLPMHLSLDRDDVVRIAGALKRRVGGA